jgi:exodeoxyribonuclease V gamma subunit
MAVTVSSAQRSESLLEALVTWLCDVPDDPFETDLVIVPNVGVRDWLTAELSAHLGSTGIGDGVVANIRFAFTDWLNTEAIDLTAELDSRWYPERLPWSVLAVLSGSSDLMPGFRGSAEPLALARHAADLMDRYTAHRPAMLRSWLVGGDHDGTDEALPLDADHRWQADLFRAVRYAIGSPSRAELLADLPERIASRSVGGHLPKRLAIFGLGTVTSSQADVLTALSPYCEIRVLAQLPSQPDGVVHPLLTGWGASAIPTRRLLGELGPVEHLGSREPGCGSLLGRLQVAIDTDAIRPRLRSDDIDGALGGGDGSIQVHACHGTTRQVEALRDALLHLAGADPSLTARDVLVICPDIRRFAPLIEPVLAEVFDRPGIPVALADRSLAGLSPVASAIKALFGFAGSRAHAGDLFSLLGEPAIRAASGLDLDDLQRVDRWVEPLHVRWGLDATHRTRWGYPPGLDTGTWSAAADRLLAGVLVQAPTPVEVAEGLAPHDDVDGSDATVIGRLARTIELLRNFCEACAVDRPLAEWCLLLAAVVRDLVQLDEEAEWHMQRFHDLLEELEGIAPTVQDVELNAREVASLVASRLGHESATTRLRTGLVTVASPAPLRGVPARVIALVGFDDQSVRPPTADGDDLLELRPRPGERDRLLDHRRMLLDVVLAARDHLVITCDVRDVTTGLEVPLSVHLTHLLEAVRSEIAQTGLEGDDLPVLVRHSRQLADPSNLGASPSEPSRLAGGGPWTHDPAAQRIAAALEAPAGHGSTWAVPSEDSVEPGSSGLTGLADSIGLPARSLLRDRLGISLPSLPDEVATEIDLWPGPLEESGLGRDLLRMLTRGGTVDHWRADRRITGGLPPGRIGELVLDEIAAEVQALVAAAGGVSNDTPHAGSTSGSSDTSHHSDDTHLDIGFTRWHPRLHLRPWLRLAELTIDDPGIDWRYRIVCRAEKSGDGPHVANRRMAGDPDQRLANALEVQRTASDLTRRTMSDAVPLFRRLSWSLLTPGLTRQKNDLDRDLRDRWTAWLHPGITLDSLLDDDSYHPVDDGLPEAGCRAKRYAEALFGTWERTTIEAPEDET